MRTQVNVLDNERATRRGQYLNQNHLEADQRLLNSEQQLGQLHLYQRQNRDGCVAGLD